MKIKNKGITLLLAMFVSSIAITLGLGVFTLLFGELGLAGTSKDSLVAFSAADSGVECALYWDTRQNAFATDHTSTITCDNDSSTVGGSSGISNFTVSFSDGSCANVQVTKSGGNTRISSLGQNICGGSPATSVQRGLEVNY